MCLSVTLYKKLSNSSKEMYRDNNWKSFHRTMKWKFTTSNAKLLRVKTTSTPPFLRINY